MLYFIMFAIFSQHYNLGFVINLIDKIGFYAKTEYKNSY